MKNTPIALPAWFVVPANSATIAVTRDNDIIQPLRPMTTTRSLAPVSSRALKSDVRGVYLLNNLILPSLSIISAPTKFDIAATVTYVAPRIKGIDPVSPRF